MRELSGAARQAIMTPHPTGRRAGKESPRSPSPCSRSNPAAATSDHIGVRNMICAEQRTWVTASACASLAAAAVSVGASASIPAANFV